MKSIFKTTLYSLLFLFLAACSKSDDNASNNSNEPNSSAEFIKFKCNGTLYEFSEPEIINSLSKSILAFEPNVKRITLFVPLNVSPGTYPIVNMPSNVNAYGVFINIIPIGLDGSSASGNMIITSVNGSNVKGTFTCTISSNGQNFEITEGSFNAG